MNLLGSALYDPAVAVSKATSSLLAMTAVDTTNLRLAITVPSHGKVRFKLRCTVTGATTCPVVLLGVMNGATVVGRVAPLSTPVTAPVATQNFILDAEFTATGLVAGAMNVDAAYAVQVIVASTNIKFGGPNTNAGANAWGAFVFEAWDPQPLTLGLAGGVNTTQVSGTAQTARDLGAQLDAAVSTRLAPTTAGRTLDVSATGGAGLDWANIESPTTTVALTGTTIGTLTTYTGNTPQTGDAFARIGAAGAGLTALGDARIANLDATVSSRSTYAGGAVASVTGNVGGNVTGSVGSVVGLTASNLDAAVSSRMATYTQPTGFLAANFPTTVASPTNITAGTMTTVTNLTNLPSIPGNWLTAAGIAAGALNGKGDWLLSSGYTAPDNASITSIKGKTDNLGFTAAGKVDANALALNGDATAAVNLSKTTKAVGRGTVGSSASTTSIPTSAFSPAGAVANQFSGRTVLFDADTATTALRGQSARITASSNSATPTLTVVALTTAPASGDTFSVL